ncbi:MAG: electron transport complex subunit RsxG [Marinagarivorans sp.]|nr:electron transport complex subunit RsxG [Marinagarivorans sp.]
MLGKSITKNSFILGAFAVVTAGIIAVTFQSTKEQIAAEERKAASAALVDLIPKSRHNNDMLRDVITLNIDDSHALGLTTPTTINVAKWDGQAIALVIPSMAHDGYSGDIKMIVAINLDGTLAGVRTLSHKETPGLGDKIDLRKSPWIHSFDNLSLKNPSLAHWKVKKDGGHFDQFTGATITPRAVVKRVKKTLELFELQKNNWLKDIPVANETAEIMEIVP